MLFSVSRNSSLSRVLKKISVIFPSKCFQVLLFGFETNAPVVELYVQRGQEVLFRFFPSGNSQLSKYCLFEIPSFLVESSSMGLWHISGIQAFMVCLLCSLVCLSPCQCRAGITMSALEWVSIFAQPSPPRLFNFFRNIGAIISLWPFHIHSGIRKVHFAKDLIGILIRTALNLLHCLERYDIFYPVLPLMNPSMHIGLVKHLSVEKIFCIKVLSICQQMYFSLYFAAINGIFIKTITVLYLIGGRFCTHSLNKAN